MSHTLTRLFAAASSRTAAQLISRGVVVSSPAINDKFDSQHVENTTQIVNNNDVEPILMQLSVWMTQIKIAFFGFVLCVRAFSTHQIVNIQRNAFSLDILFVTWVFEQKNSNQ